MRLLNQTGIKDRYEGTIFSQGSMQQPQGTGINPMYTGSGSMGHSPKPTGMLQNPQAGMIQNPQASIPHTPQAGIPPNPQVGMPMLPVNGMAPNIRTDIPPTEWWEQELQFLALDRKR